MSRPALRSILVLGVIAVASCSSSGSSSAAPEDERPWSRPKQFLVFLDVRATDAEVQGLRHFLAASPHVERFRYVSKDDAYADFRRYVERDRPELGASVTAADLPASFDVRTRTQADIAKLARSLESMPGVDQIQRPPRAKLMREICRLLEEADFRERYWKPCTRMRTR